MRSSSGNAVRGWRRRPTLCALALITMVVAASGTSAHRRDEYLQAARLGIDPARVELELDLTAGTDVADAVFREIDRDRDGVLSADEQRRYSRQVMNALTLEIDATPLRPRLDVAAFADRNAMRRGQGSIRLRISSSLPRLRDGRHRLRFRNRHDPGRSAYLANALVPRDGRVRITSQRRDRIQRELTVEYVLIQCHPACPQ